MAKLLNWTTVLLILALISNGKSEFLGHVNPIAGYNPHCSGVNIDHIRLVLLKFTEKSSMSKIDELISYLFSYKLA